MTGKKCVYKNIIVLKGMFEMTVIDLVMTISFKLMLMKMWQCEKQLSFSSDWYIFPSQRWLEPIANHLKCLFLYSGCPEDVGMCENYCALKKCHFVIFPKSIPNSRRHINLYPNMWDHKIQGCFMWWQQ